MTAPLAKTPLTLEERKAKREARRAKQRVENIGRAAKMHQARLAWDRDNDVQKALPARTGTVAHVGCSGWFYWPWRGLFYPEGMPTSRWFSHYAGQFKTVELNAPFYSWPTTAAVSTWVRQIAKKQFIYTVKVSELITHVKRFTGTKTLVRDFGHIADLLGPQMGCFLFQLPPSFQYTPARLKRILDQLDPRRRNVVEFRHRSWWNDDAFDAFRASGAIFCSCSGPRLPDQLVKTADEIYLRFHGIKQWYRHNYTRGELETWAARVRASGAKRVWAYFNNDRDGNAIKNARMFLRLLSHGRAHEGMVAAWP